MGKFTDRTGEINYNNQGLKMEIIKYRNTRDIDVYFSDYDYVKKHVRYDHFKEGTLKCPYEPRLYGYGYLGEGKYKTKENGKDTKCYITWYRMLERCYSDKWKNKYPTYKNVTVCKEWLNFQNFAKWYYKNYYQIKGERMELDKDILIKGNKIYSPETCVFVSQRINKLFVKNDKVRGKSAIGTYHLENGKYRAYCNLINPQTGKSKLKHLGYYDIEVEAFEVYKYHKERNIKEVADYYKERIPEKLYDAMYNYIVEITD